MVPSPDVVQDLESLTRDLERKVPSLKGSFPDFERYRREITAKSKRKTIYVFGTIKSGKSTLLNAMLGIDVLPRGSGVKTFSLTRLRHESSERAWIRFKSARHLADMLEYDFRILGRNVDLQADLYSTAGIHALRAVYDAFERECRNDGRLERLRADSSLGLLPLSFARVQRVLLGLEELQHSASKATLDHIVTMGRLDFSSATSSDFQQWLSVPNYAALIDDIAIGVPFPMKIPGRVELCDSQGSDSVNPLDFAAVESVIHRADLILYVVNSRMGLRRGDQQLLQQIRTGGAQDKVLLVINREAYAPMSLAESNQLLGRIYQDFAATGIPDSPGSKVMIVNALEELYSQVDPSEAKNIDRIWRKQGHATVFQNDRENFAKLREKVAEVDDGTLADAANVEPTLFLKTRTTAQALLERDQRFAGIQAGSIDIEQTKRALQRIVAAEAQRLGDDLTATSLPYFASDGPLQKNINRFLKAAAKDYAKNEKVPDDLAHSKRHAPVVAAATEFFNSQWQELNQELIRGPIRECLEKSRRLIIAASTDLLSTVRPVIPESVLRWEKGWLADPQQFRTRIERELDYVMERILIPQPVRPIVLSAARSNRLAASFYARHFLSFLERKISGENASPQKHPQKHAKRVRLLWRRALQASLKSAKDDQEFSVSSCRENLKFGFYKPLITAFLERIETLLLEQIHDYLADMERLQSAGSLLLSGRDRDAVTQFLQTIEQRYPDVAVLRH